MPSPIITAPHSIVRRTSSDYVIWIKTPCGVVFYIKNVGKERMSRRRKTYHKKRVNKQALFLTLGGVLSFIVLVVFLCGIVIGDNAKECGAIKLGGNILGCSTAEKYTFDSLYFVIGNTSNSPSPEISETVEKYLVNSIVDKASKSDVPDIKLYSASSAQNKIPYKIDVNKSDDDSIEGLVEYVNEQLDQFREAIIVPPIADGAQYLETISRVAKTMNSKKDEGEKSILIVIGSGLSDGGLLNFTQGDILHSNNLDEVLVKLANSEDVVDGVLDDTTILWSSLGEVAYPQSRLSDLEVEKLQQIYSTVLEEMGADLLDYDDYINENSSVTSDYKVNNTTTKMSECLWCHARVLTNDDLGFNPDSSSFKNRDMAISKIASLAEEMKKNSSEVVTITGYEARANCSNNVSSLPKQRAEAIKRMLIEMGISEDRITTVNGGKGGNNDCVNGRFIESEGAKNRVVKFEATIN